MSGFLTVKEVLTLTGGRLEIPPSQERTVSAEQLEQTECSEWSPDSREVVAGGVFLAVGGGERFALEAAQRGAALAVACEPLAALPTVVVEDVQAMLGRLAQHRRATLHMPVIAVAGSSGKTSTKNLLAAALAPLGEIHASKRSFNNEIGVPITVLECPAEAGALIVECGERKIGDLAYLASIITPDGVVIASLGSAHAEYLGGPDGVARECGDLVARARHWVIAWSEDVRQMVHYVPRGIEVLVAVLGEERSAEEVRVAARILSLELDAHGRATLVGDTPRGSFTSKLGLLGRHQARNAVLAVAAASECGIAPDEAAKAVETAVAERGRGDLRVRNDGMRVIDDTYNANPDSMRAGIELLCEIPSERRVAILGEMRELGEEAEAEHEALGAFTAKAGIDLLIALGPYRVALQAGFASHAGARSATVSITDLEEIPQYVTANDVVLVKASRGARLERVVDLLMEGPK